MAHFERRYRFEGTGPAARILAMAAAHHRLNYIHPFPDGNGRVSRLMSHAMALKAGIGAQGLWSVVAWSRPGPRQPPGIQDLDGPCRYAASGRSGWARQPLAEGTCRLHSLVSEGMPRPG